MNDSFSAFLKQEREKSVGALTQAIEDRIDAYTGLSETFDVTLDYLPEYVTTGGKFGRPLLSRLSYAICGGKKDELILQISVALELLHRFILAHDDVIDRDKMRHGIATYENHLRDFSQKQGMAEPDWFGLSGAIVAGDVLHSFVFDVIAEVEVVDSVRVKLLRGVSECLLETAAGWQLETMLKQSPISEVSEQQIMTAMRLVSAHYSVLWPLRIGQLATGVEYGDWDEALEQYGLAVGLAFQMQDDVLGVFGETEKTGKPVGNDVREGKKTLLIYNAYEKASDSERTFIETYLGQTLNAEQLSRFQEIITKTGALSRVQQQAQEQVERGLVALDEVDEPNSPAVERLRQLADFLVEREY